VIRSELPFPCCRDGALPDVASSRGDDGSSRRPAPAPGGRSRETRIEGLAEHHDRRPSPFRPGVLKHGPGTALLALGAALVLVGCPAAPRGVVYDLAARAPVAERWSSREVLLFGTPAAEPFLPEGFYREAGAGGEPFLWSKTEAEVALRFDAPGPRAAIVDMAPYEGAPGQSVEVSLNGVSVAAFPLDDRRSRYRLDLPESAQRPGDNRLRFAFAKAASPADRDPRSRDRRRLAAAFYSLTIGRAADAGLDDLLRRGAPRPFEVTDVDGAPSLSLVGPALVRFAVRLPRDAELRFTPELSRMARTSAGAAAFSVTLESSQSPGVERQLWSRVLRANDEAPGEVRLRLPGAAGEIVRVGLLVGAADGGRFAWGSWRAPRILGRDGSDPLAPEPFAPADDARADGLRRELRDANVVFVILDAARQREFGAYGYERAATPEIDRIAADGVVFDRAYTPAVYTLGAMSSVWTSQYPDRHHGNVSFSSPLPRDRLTLAEVLSSQGIFTAGFVATAVPGGFNRLDRGFEEFHELWQEIGSRADVFRQVLPAWLEKNKGRRFFAYLHYREPHFPYDPPPPFDTKFGPEGPIPKARRGDAQFFKDINQGRRSFSEEERAHLVRLYDGSLAYVDREIGALRRAMEAAGVWDRTVMIVAADHGEELGEHHWIGHNVHVYEPCARIPLIVRFPKGAGPRGVRVGARVGLRHGGPTKADLLRVIEGAKGRPLVISRTVWDRPRYGLRDERWTYTYDSATGQEALFDRAEDPGEMRNVAAEHPLRTEWLRETLHQWMRSAFRPGVAPEEAPPAMTKAQCEDLKSLGYVESCPEK
jgi:arylsulfatase A-like enzyme